MKQIAIALLLWLPLVSCQPTKPESTEKDALEAKVMEVHDVAMADMDKIYKLRKNLRQLRDSLSTQPADSATLRNLDRHVFLLQQADEAMMNWMRQYKAPVATLANDSAMQYLQSELTKIERVKFRMDSTISASEKLSQTFENRR